MKYKLQKIESIASCENIFFVGIKGVGMTSLAIITKEAGFNIIGSDVSEEFITDKSLKEAGIEVVDNFETDTIKAFFKQYEKDKCLVITTGAHKGFDNPQVKWAKENGYKVLSQGQALGEFMDGEIFNREFRGIAIAGAHGKTTISSLLASTLIQLSEDVSYSIGTGEVFPQGLPGHFGKSEYFVSEADEYASEPNYDKVPKFLYLRPFYAIINNIDFDHPDIFSSIEEVEDAFLELTHNIQSRGTIFMNGDDENCQKLKKNILKDIRVITYGENNNCTYRIGKVVLEGHTSSFTVYKRGEEVGFFKINLPGYHNAKNALSAVSLLIEMGYEPRSIKDALLTFKGSKRRMEEVGRTVSKSLIIDDYAHHPKEISTTLSAVKVSYPDKKILCIFQPHTFSRTKALLSEFSTAFKNCDRLILLPVFKSQRDVEKDGGEFEDLVSKLKEVTDTTVIQNFEGVVEYVEQEIKDDKWVIVTMGAGDVYKVAYKIQDDK